jgi:hypothetical protein
VVVVAHRHTAIDKHFRREIFVVVRKPLLDRAPKQRLVIAIGRRLKIAPFPAPLISCLIRHASNRSYAKISLKKSCMAIQER